jgi:hypothetical protein
METRAAERLEGLFESRPASARGGLLGVLVFLVVLPLVSTGYRALHDALPEYRDEQDIVQRTKRKYLMDHLEDYDLLFLGDSQVYRHVIPATFDRRVARGGLELTSYNLGLPGSRFFETLHRVEWLLAREPQRLQYLVIAVSDPDPPFKWENLFAKREIDWHTPRLTVLALRTVLASDRPALQKARELGGHLVQFGCAFTGAGTAVPAASVVLWGQVVPEDPTARGFLSLEVDPNPDNVARRREFLEALTLDRDLLQRRADAVRAQRDSVEPTQVLVDALTELVASLRAAGVEPVFVLYPPAPNKRPEIRGAHEAGAIPNLISFADPDAYPALYNSLKQRFDENHLNKAGASRLSVLLGEEFLEVVGEDGSE